MSAPGPEQNAAPRPPAWEAGVVVAALAIAVVGLVWWSRPDANPGGRASARYVGPSQCRECHPAEADAYARSGHSQTLRRVAGSPLVDRLDGVTAADPERAGVTWTYRRQGDDLTAERREGDSVVRSVLEYAMGSGRHATTFVTLTSDNAADPALVEHRLSLFAHQSEPGLTPGQSITGSGAGHSPAGREHGRFNTLKCFECHTTINSDRGPAFLDRSTMIANVGCERCHGPGRDHVAAARAGRLGDALRMPLGPGHTAPADELTACGQCHRLPSMVAAAELVPENTVLVRHQPVGLMQSACYARSGGGLSCSTCHDPHDRPSADTSAYEAACLSCHRGTDKTPCPVDPKAGCIDCHMPRRETTRGMTFTDHWIRARPLAARPGTAPEP